MRAESKGRIRVFYGVRESGTRFIQGLIVDGEIIETHLKTWTVEKAGKKP